MIEYRRLRLRDLNAIEEAAGLKRLGIETWPNIEFAPLDFDQMVPAVGQGAIAIETDGRTVQVTPFVRSVAKEALTPARWIERWLRLTWYG